MRNTMNEELLNTSLTDSLEKIVQNFKTVLNVPDNEDAVFRTFFCAGKEMCAIYMEGMADEEKIGQLVLHAAKYAGIPQEVQDGNGFLTFFSENILEIAQTDEVTELREAIERILSGMTCLLADGADSALILETRNYPHRGVEQPTNESVVIGAHEAFNEHLRTNISLVRRYVQSRQLITQKVRIGTKISSQAAVLYLKGVASEASVREIKRRLKCVNAASVGSSGALEQLIEDHPFALLPQILQTERPDRAASCLKDGQVAILIENSPYALIAPVTMFHLLHAPDDSALRWQYGTALRVIRAMGMLISLILPSLYVATTLYHSHLIPMQMLTAIAESRVNVPFPILAEVLFMEFSFYLLNEAGLRTPTQIGSAFGIVGALILGQAAASASVISPILIIIIALTGLGNYVITDYGFGIGIVLYRLFLILLSALYGVYGLMIGLFLIVGRICAMKSFGVDYLSPIAPKRLHNPDILLRLPMWMQKRTLFFARKRNWMEDEHD